MTRTLPTDRGLQARMVVTVVLLAGLYAGFVGVLVAYGIFVAVSFLTRTPTVDARDTFGRSFW